MKKILLLSAITIFAISNFSFTGTDFEGKIVFDIDFNSPNMPDEAKAMMAGSELTIYIKGSKTRSDIEMPMQNSTTISDSKTKTSVRLVEAGGNKYKIKNEEPAADKKTPDATIKYLDETKEIAGYKCKKAEITFKDKAGESHTTAVYYTEEISNQMGSDNRSSQFKDLKGMPLEYEIYNERGSMKMTATSVSKEKVPDSKFEIPSGYKEPTLEEMQKEMMKMYQQH